MVDCLNIKKMHELSVALSIIEIVEKEAKRENADKVVKLELDIGLLAGIEFDSLDFSLNMAKNGTIMENAEIVVNKIEAKAVCANCKETFIVKNHFEECPSCCEYQNEIIEGKDLKVKSLVIDV